MADNKKPPLCLSICPLQGSMSVRKFNETKSFSSPKMLVLPTNQNSSNPTDRNSNTITNNNDTNNSSNRNKRQLPRIRTKNHLFRISKPHEAAKPEIAKNNCNLYLDFSKFHYKNLCLIKKLSDKAEALKLVNTTSTRVESPMERYKKIKRFFLIKCTNEGGAKASKRKKINDSSEANDNKSIEENEQLYYTLYHQGNNSDIITKCLSLRTIWEECPNDKTPHFIWSPASMNIDFALFTKSRSNKRMTNHFEFHNQITNKLHLFLNMLAYCESKAIDVFNYFPMTIMIQYDSQTYLKQFLSFSSIFNSITDYISETGDNKKRYRNYFELESKERIGYKTPFYIKDTHFNNRNMWLLKATDLNRGRCIKIGNTIEDIEKIIKLFYIGLVKSSPSNDNRDNQSKANERKVYFFPNIKAKEFPSLKDFKQTKDTYRSGIVILQKYIEKPLLYHGRKFDLRLWVMLSHKMRIYVFKEGHLKTSSLQFDIASNNVFIHLTNYSVQKKCSEFSKYEPGNEISFEQFQYCLSNEHKFNVSFRLDLFPQLCHIVKISLKSVRNKINADERQHCFEILGYDFMFDANCKPFLIEVNTNPGLEISSPLIEELVPRMVNDALKITLDDVFHNNKKKGASNGCDCINGYDTKTNNENNAINNDGNSNKECFPVKGYDDNVNMWELVGNIYDCD